MQALQEVRGSQRVTSQDPEATYEALERYGRDLTKLAEQGKLDPVIGRDDEIRRVIQVLSRRTKNNPVLIGEPGSARPPSLRAWRSASCAATSRRDSRTSASSPSTWGHWSLARSIAANSKSA